MNAGDKYIIEIAEVIETDKGMKLGRVKGFDSLVMTEFGLNQLEEVKRCEAVSQCEPEVSFGTVVKFKMMGTWDYGVVLKTFQEDNKLNLKLMTQDGETFTFITEFEVVGSVYEQMDEFFSSLDSAIKQNRREKK